MSSYPALGAVPAGGGAVQLAVWAPNCARVDVRLLDASGRHVSMQRDDAGYFTALVEGVKPGDRYVYVLDGDTERPDPASRYQPDGVHAPSVVVDPDAFDWTDQSWRGRGLDEFVIYELHVGTFTPEGTFDAVIPKLDELIELGVTVIELMPVAQFPGDRNWGYDGVGLFAVQSSYGGPEGLRRLVNACHERGLAIILDVVYNHLGPEGNYLNDFGPYFTDHYRTPWGDALNFDGPESDHVRNFFLQNARYWIREFHFDGFRIDAVHSIHDASATHFLEELAAEVHVLTDRLGRRAVLIAESDLNDPKVIRSREMGGWGHDAQWADDLHHALHALLTGEQDGYYVDYGSIQSLVDALADGYMFTGQYSAHRKRRHGRQPGIRDGRRYVVCSQNHDQVGNRAAGDRLTANLDFDQLKIAAGVTILSPFLPMLFMGEEYAEPAPFQYFVSHGDEALVKAVQEGRRREFESFNWQATVPDPQATSTFEHSRLNHDLKTSAPHSHMLAWYRELLRLRRETPALGNLDLDSQRVWAVPGTMVLASLRQGRDRTCLLLFNFSSQPAEIAVDLPDGEWTNLLNSRDTRWGGPGDDAPALAVEGGTAHIPVAGRALLVYEAAAQ
jgi:maltooligosyltrehalose trehalohydrolase